MFARINGDPTINDWPETAGMPIITNDSEEIGWNFLLITSVLSCSFLICKRIWYHISQKFLCQQELLIKLAKYRFVLLLKNLFLEKLEKGKKLDSATL